MKWLKYSLAQEPKWYTFSLAQVAHKFISTWLKNSLTFTFDELSSSLDTNNEAKFMRLMGENLIEKTIIVVSHTYGNMNNF